MASLLCLPYLALALCSIIGGTVSLPSFAFPWHWPPIMPSYIPLSTISYRNGEKALPRCIAFADSGIRSQAPSSSIECAVPYATDSQHFRRTQTMLLTNIISNRGIVNYYLQQGGQFNTEELEKAINNSQEKRDTISTSIYRLRIVLISPAGL